MPLGKIVAIVILVLTLIFLVLGHVPLVIGGLIAGVAAAVLLL